MTITYGGKEIPVYGSFDTVVIGGGTSGAIAAISALKEGLSTLVIDINGGLGGLQTVGLVSPIMGFFMNGVQPKSGMDQLLEEELKKINGMEPDYREDYIDFNPLCTQFVIEKLIREMNGKILLHTACIDTIMDGTRLDAIVIHNKGGIQAVKAKTFIDCSGDADVCRLSGVEAERGGKSGFNQKTTLRFEMGGVDIDKFFEFRLIKDENGEFVDVLSDQYKEFFEEGYQKGQLPEVARGGVQLFTVWGKPGCIAFNGPDMPPAKDVTDPDYISETILNAREAIFQYANYMKENMPGFENAYISQFADMLGTRESYRIKAEYVLNVNDVFDYKKFPDGIALSNYHMDVHGGCEEDYKILSRGYIDVPEEERYFEIPFRSLIAAGVDNLLCAGRCAGGDFYTQSAFRIQHLCRYMGEAAGVGCRFAIEENKPFREIDGAKVRKVMADRGAVYLKK